MSIYITKDGEKRKVNISATDVQLLDIDGRFKNKNLEDALKEVGSGTEENMTRIEEQVIEHTAQLKDVAYKNGTLQTNLNSEKINGKTVNDLMRFEGVIPSNANLNEYRTIGTKYRIVDSANITNYSPKENNSELIIHGDTENALVQVVYTSTGKIFMRSYQSWRINNWSEWSQLATSESVEITSFQNGWARHPDLSYGTGLTKVGNLVNLSILVVNPSPSAGTTIFTVPTGFRPSKSIIFPSLQGASCIEARIFTDGRVIINSGSMISNHWISLQATYSL